MKIPLDYKQPMVLNMIVPYKINTRTGVFRTSTLGVCIHHTGNMGWNAWTYWNAMQKSWYTDTASYHFIIDLNGDIWQVIPSDEEVYGSGAHQYSKVGKYKFFSRAWKYTVDIEVCVAEPNYTMNERQLEVLAELCADLCIHYELDPYIDLWRHHDIAEDKPECPLYLLNDIRWEQLKAMCGYFHRLKQKGDFPLLDITYIAA